MSYPVTASVPYPPRAPVIAAATVQRGLLWLLGVSGGIVFIEPSPFEMMMAVSLTLFVIIGLRLNAASLLLAILLFFINIGYCIGAAGLLDDGQILNWILTSWYMAVIAVFFSMAMAEDAAARLDNLLRGYVVAALIASLAGIAGYFHLLPKSDEILLLYGRARGTFKDPNVLGAFLILPALMCLQVTVTAKFWRALRAAIALGIITIALFLAFSRAAWGMLAGGSALLLLLMLASERSAAQRRRIVFSAAAAIACLAVALIVLLSIDSISGLFKERASFDQSYDTGRFGRFGRHALGFQMALDVPFGIGPLQFKNFFPEDTHNSWLNAFMSGGWLSGVMFPTLILTSVVASARICFRRTPWQRHYLVVFSAFMMLVAESFVIDVDHWRHFFMTLGCVWGLLVATRRWSAQNPEPPAHHA